MLNAAQFTVSVWPRSCSTIALVSLFHTPAVSSPLAVTTMVLLEGWNALQYTASVWPTKFAEESSRRMAASLEATVLASSMPPAPPSSLSYTSTYANVMHET